MVDHYILISSASVLREDRGCPHSRDTHHHTGPRRLSILPSPSQYVSWCVWPLSPAKWRLNHLSGISLPLQTPFPQRTHCFYNVFSHVIDIFYMFFFCYFHTTKSTFGCAQVKYEWENKYVNYWAFCRRFRSCKKVILFSNWP